MTIAALVAISAIAMPITISGRSAMTWRLSIIPTARKNSPSRIERNGSTSASSSCRYGESASITPATNAPSAVERWRILHQRRGGDDGEQRGEHEHLALAEIADHAEQRAQQVAPDQDQPADREHGLDEQQPARRPAACRRGCATGS